MILHLINNNPDGGWKATFAVFPDFTEGNLKVKWGSEPFSSFITSVMVMKNLMRKCFSSWETKNKCIRYGMKVA